jgi:hypothetical protein
MSHQLKSTAADSIYDPATLFRVGDLELLLQEDARLDENW